MNANALCPHALTFLATDLAVLLTKTMLYPAVKEGKSVELAEGKGRVGGVEMVLVVGAVLGWFVAGLLAFVDLDFSPEAKEKKRDSSSLVQPSPLWRTASRQKYVDAVLQAALTLQAALSTATYVLAPWTKQLVWAFKVWRAKENAEDEMEDQVDDFKDGVDGVVGKVKLG
ncbi:hypothetical protein JCM8547_007595 [Rhodosporidiobolus lusitaniae]